MSYNVAGKRMGILRWLGLFETEHTVIAAALMFVVCTSTLNTSVNEQAMWKLMTDSHELNQAYPDVCFFAIETRETAQMQYCHHTLKKRV